MLAALGERPHVLHFLGSQARRPHARTAPLIVEFTAELELAPAVVSGRRETSDSKRRPQRHLFARSIALSSAAFDRQSEYRSYSVRCFETRSIAASRPTTPVSRAVR